MSSTQLRAQLPEPIPAEPTQDGQSALLYHNSHDLRVDNSIEKASQRVLNYRPSILQPWPLASLAIMTIVLLGLLQYAATVYPHPQQHYGSLSVRSIQADSLGGILHRDPAHEDSTSSSSNFELKTTIEIGDATFPIKKCVISSASFVVREVGPSASASSSAPPSNSETVPTAFVRSTSAPATTATASTAFVRSTHPTTSHTTTIRKDSTKTVYSNATPDDTRTTVQTIQQTLSATATHSVRTSLLVVSGTTVFTVVDTTTKTANGFEEASSRSATASAKFSASSAVCAADSQSQECLAYQHNQMTSPQTLRAGSVFLALYFPTLIAAVYRMLWTNLSSSFSLVEPFRLLARPEGAPAREVFFSSYQSKQSLLGPLQALSKRYWAQTIVLATALAMDLLPALASESLYVSTNWANCPDRHPLNTNNPCPRRIEAGLIAIRVQQALLAFACIVIVWLVLFLRSSKTGLPYDPWPMATIASLMRHPVLLEKLHAMPVDASTQDMQQLFGEARYRLNYFDTASGDHDYGFEPRTHSSGDHYTSLSDLLPRGSKLVNGSTKVWKRVKISSNISWMSEALLIVMVFGTFAVVLAYYLDYDNDGFNRFFNSGTFGPRFILTLVGTIIATLWKSIEHTTMIMASYQRLAMAPSTPGNTILFRPSFAPFVSTFRALRHRYFSLAAVTIVTLLADLGLNVMISGVPYAKAQSYRQSKASAYASLVALGIMQFVAVASVVYRLRAVRLPRQPDTIGAVMSYLAHSRMLEEFEGVEDSTGPERDSRILSMGKEYELTKSETNDGSYLWTVDET